MNEKTQGDDFENEEGDEDLVGDETIATDDVDIDHLFRDLEKRKRAAPKSGDPAWRRLEKYREERHTKELVSDFDDFDIVEPTDEAQDSKRHIG
jgi:hypothetical protein